MRLKQLGQTGLYVSEICLGTMTFGGGGYFKAFGAQDQGEATRMVRRALDAGVNFFDTANVYSDGLSEQILGQALRDLGIARERVIIATKVFAQIGRDANAGGSFPNDAGLSRRHIVSAVEGSLKRLGMEHIDLYQAHGYDPLTPFDETMRAFDDLIRAGKVRYAGCSNWSAWHMVDANGIARREHLNRLQSVQAYYSLVGRDIEREIVPMLKSHRLGLLVWSPLAGGFLSGKYTREGTPPEDARRLLYDSPPVQADRGFRVLDALQKVASNHGSTVVCVALAWLLHQPAVTSVIIGAKRESQLEDNLGAVGIRLDEDDIKALHKASALPIEYPGWQISYQSGWRMASVAEPTARKVSEDKAPMKSGGNLGEKK